MKFLKIGFVLTALTAFIIACSQSNQTNNTANNSTSNANSVANSRTSEPAASASPAIDELAAAKSVYVEKCAGCHKENGSGGKVTIDGKTINADNLTTEKMKNMADEKYIKYIENGIPDEGMPAFKGKLTDEQIKNLVKFIRKEFQGKS
jgi:mono/diheme cytochrome c family protein